MYTPPFIITSNAINLIAEIAAQAERFAIRMEMADGVILRKVNRMKTIHGTLAIEGNTLSEEQVTAMIDGKYVVAPIREVQEVRNAINAYDEFMSFDPYNRDDLLRAHGIMALGLVDRPGSFRSGNVCVAGKNGVSHIAPPADRVPFLIDDLFDWLKSSNDHILIKSSVFHYEFEFIHPFDDGNGRMGRFWQSRLLAEWNPVFANLPIENMIWENQSGYYKAIEDSSKVGNSGIFVEFMLGVILRELKSRIQKRTQNEGVNPENDGVNLENEGVNPEIDGVNPEIDGVKFTKTQQRILKVLQDNPAYTQDEMAQIIGITSANIFKNMKKLREMGIIRRIGADKNGYWEIIRGAK